MIVQGEFSKENGSQILIADSSTMMMKIIFDDVSAVTSQNNFLCIFTPYAEAVVLSAVILIVIGLVLGLIIIIVRKLHSTSTKNSFFMVIT
ncbi:unnamed protein product, partial [Schistosoma margrebowiei]|uniref:Uncharacterized protein n=1 Tax=Schistosoma margrebowiei TaxID=48269 RepID=A0AA85ALX0_9TREM